MWPFSKRAAPVEERATDENVAALIQALMGKTDISRKEALEIPTVSACIEIIANAVTSLPIKLYKQNEGETENVRDDYRLRLLNQETGDCLTAKQFWKAMIADYYLSPNGANAYLKKSAGKIKSVHYVEGDKISLLKSEHPIFKNYIMYIQDGEYYPHEFFRLMRHTKDGCYSKPLQEENPLIMSVAYNSMKFEECLVKKGGNKKGFLQSESRLDKAAVDELKQAYRNLYTNGTDNVVVLNKGITFKESSNTSVEMQMNESKQANAAEIAKLFPIPYNMLLGKATKEDIEQFIKLCLNPLLVDIECSMNNSWLLEREKNDYYFAFDTKELTRANIKERYEAYEVGLKNHFLQPDEVRDWEDLEPLGIEWVELGLNSVLYDIKNKTIYTPNTDKKTDLKKEGEVVHESGD